jgi:hypothetical protein
LPRTSHGLRSAARPPKQPAASQNATFRPLPLKAAESPQRTTSKWCKLTGKQLQDCKCQLEKMWATDLSQDWQFAAGSGSKPVPIRVNRKKCSPSIKPFLILENSSHVSWISARNPSTPCVIANGNKLLEIATEHLPITLIQPQIPPLTREATRVESENSETRVQKEDCPWCCDKLPRFRRHSRPTGKTRAHGQVVNSLSQQTELEGPTLYCLIFSPGDLRSTMWL